MRAMLSAWKKRRERSVQSAVLAAMWSHGLSRVDVKRIATSSRSGPAAVRRALRVLEAAGLVTEERRTGLWALSTEGQRVAGRRLQVRQAGNHR